MDNQNTERETDDRLELLVRELDDMLAAGELDPEAVGDRFDALFTPSEDLWFIHFTEVPLRMSLPGTGEFSPWIGVIIDAETGDIIFAHTTDREPEPEEIAVFLLAHMVEEGAAPAAIDVINDRVGQSLNGVATLLGIDLGVPEEQDFVALEEAMAEFTTQISEEDMRMALSQQDSPDLN